MKKFLGLKRVKTAVFISGTGSNLRSLIRFSLKKNSPIKIMLVISNNKKAKGLIFCKKYKIKSKIYSFFRRQKDEIKILEELNNNRIHLICLAGFMKILSKNFIRKFRGKIINIHPSILPKYKGLNTHQRALKNGDKFSGCTVHFVNSKIDSGKIILQKKVRILKKDTPEILAKKILKQEHKIYPLAVKKILTNY